MSTFDDRDTALAHDAGYGEAGGYGQQSGLPHQPVAPHQQQPQQPYYGYGMPYGEPMRPGMMGGSRYGRMYGGGSETKPFFLTSEFLGTLLCILGVCITAASARYLDAHGAALFSTILVAAYTISRGIAKAGTRSRASDPRDELHFGGHGNDHRQ